MHFVDLNECESSLLYVSIVDPEWAWRVELAHTDLCQEEGIWEKTHNGFAK